MRPGLKPAAWHLQLGKLGAEGRESASRLILDGADSVEQLDGVGHGWQRRQEPGEAACTHTHRACGVGSTEDGYGHGTRGVGSSAGEQCARRQQLGDSSRHGLSRPQQARVRPCRDGRAYPRPLEARWCGRGRPPGVPGPWPPLRGRAPREGRASSPAVRILPSPPTAKSYTGDTTRQGGIGLRGRASAARLTLRSSTCAARRRASPR